MTSVLVFFSIMVLFCVYRIAKQLFVLIPATLRTWNIVKYLKKSAMISYVVSEAEKKGLFERYEEIRLKHGRVNYVARKDNEGTIWLGDYEINQIVYDPPKIKNEIENVKEMLYNTDYVLFQRFFLKQLGMIHRTVLAIS